MYTRKLFFFLNQKFKFRNKRVFTFSGFAALKQFGPPCWMLLPIQRT